MYDLDTQEGSRPAGAGSIPEVQHPVPAGARGLDPPRTPDRPRGRGRRRQQVPTSASPPDQDERNGCVIPTLSFLCFKTMPPAMSQ